jgi:nucleoside-diphosphate-sugar epimerase
LSETGTYSHNQHLTKAVFENYLHIIAAERRIVQTPLIITDTYGRFDGRNKIIPQLVSHYLEGKQKPEIKNPKNILFPVYLDDVVQIIDQIIFSDADHRWRKIQIGSGVGLRVEDIDRLIRDHINGVSTEGFVETYELQTFSKESIPSLSYNYTDIHSGIEKLLIKNNS